MTKLPSLRGEDPGSRYNPFEFGEYKRLFKQSRRSAAILGADPSVGEDVLNSLLTDTLEGRTKAIESAARLDQLVRWRIKDRNRRDRKSEPLHRYSVDEDDFSRDRRLVLLGLVEVPDAADESQLEEHLRREFSRALEGLPGEERAALLSQLRGQLLSEGGEEGVRAFERYWLVQLGPHAGTAALAEATSTSEGTVAARAHRAKRRLRRLLANKG